MDYRERFELKEFHNEQRLGRRVRWVHVGLLGLMVFFLLNFWYLQGVQGDRFARLAENNRLRKIPLPPYRGLILDRSDRVLASTRPSLNLVLRRESLRDLGGQIARLAPILDETPETLRERYDVMRTRPPYEALILREDVALPELARIEARKELFPSVEVHQAARRNYPAGDGVAHALGYIGEVSTARLDAAVPEAGLQRGDLVGKSGIERVYDDQLRGRRGFSYVSVNNLGRRLGPEQIGTAPVHGRPLRTTLDLRLQMALSEGFGDEAGAGVFMDPKTGEILALVSAPSYDPNDFVNGITRETWDGIQSDARRPLHNRAIASFYAPGSTFKVIVALAGLETGEIDSQTTVFCNGSTRIHGRTRLCWKRGGHGWVDLRKALTHSCNVYFYKLGQSLGVESIHKYGAMFGLGEVTGVDLTGESGGILPSDAWKRRVHGERWYPGDTISVSIGQGLLAVTPLQMATVMSGVATGGTVPRPYVNAETRPHVRTADISPAALALVRSSLDNVVSSGTGWRAALDGIQVAGKTGTAQVYKHSAGIDSDLLPKDERDHAWFVGYAPADDPQIAFAVVVEHGGHGGTTAAPIVRKVLDEFFRKEVPVESAPPPAEPDPSRIAQRRRASDVGPTTPR